jgi:transglutaminase-like putative cysteine protease
MRIKVRHETNYTYADAASSALQLLRLTPRSHDGQFVRRWRVGVDTDARLDKSEDAYGNLTHLVFLHGPLTEVRIVIEGEVDTEDTGGFVKGTVERQPEGLFLRESALTRASPALQKFARETRAAQGGDLLPTLHALCGRINRELEFKVGTTTAATTAEEAFKAQTGVCQDFAHVLIAAARALGVPARYVSGYYLRTDRVDQDAGHAWMEAHVADIGWIGFDPAQGLCISDRYIRVAIGCDALDAAPVRGATVGGGGESLDVAILVQQGRAVAQD